MSKGIMIPLGIVLCFLALHICNCAYSKKVLEKRRASSIKTVKILPNVVFTRDNISLEVGSNNLGMVFGAVGALVGAVADEIRNSRATKGKETLGLKMKNSIDRKFPGEFKSSLLNANIYDICDTCGTIDASILLVVHEFGFANIGSVKNANYMPVLDLKAVLFKGNVSDTIFNNKGSVKNPIRMVDTTAYPVKWQMGVRCHPGLSKYRSTGSENLTDFVHDQILFETAINDAMQISVSALMEKIQKQVKVKKY